MTGLDRPLGDREPQTAAAGRAALRPPVEPLEEPPLVAGRDAGTGVAHLENRVPGRDGHAEPDLAFGRRVPNGVVHEVDHRLPQRDPIAAAVRAGRVLDGHRLPLLLGEHPEMRGHLVGQRPEVDGSERQREIAAVGARHQQQPVDEPRQPVGLLEHALDDLLVGAGIARLAQPDLSDAADGGQRRPQLVRHVGGELPHLLERGLQPAEGVVEHRREPAELVARAVDGQPLVEPGRGDGAGPLGHAVQRGQRPARQEIAAGAGHRHRQRQPQQQEEGELAHFEPHERLRAADLDHHRLAADGDAGAEDPERGRIPRQRANPAVRLIHERLARRHRQPRRDRRPIDEPAGGTPDLEPRAVRAPRIPLEPGQGTVRPLLGHLRRPAEVAPEAGVEGAGQVAGHQRQHHRDVDAQHRQHDRHVPQRQARAQRVRPPAPAHASPARSMNPTPRTV